MLITTNILFGKILEDDLLGTIDNRQGSVPYEVFDDAGNCISSPAPRILNQYRPYI